MWPSDPAQSVGRDRSRSARLVAPLAALCLAGLTGCGHGLRAGTYTLSLDGRPSVDSCGLTTSATTWTGKLSTNGQEVLLKLDLPVSGDSTSNLEELSGFFKAGQLGAEDGFLADATGADVPTPVPGVSGGCLADTLNIHMDANIQDNQHFSGQLSFTYQLTPSGNENAPCNKTRCELVVGFRAAHAGR